MSHYAYYYTLKTYASFHSINRWQIINNAYVVFIVKFASVSS